MNPSYAYEETAPKYFGTEDDIKTQMESQRA